MASTHAYMRYRTTSKCYTSMTLHSTESQTKLGNVPFIFKIDNSSSKPCSFFRYCNEFQTCLFGGQGERIQIDSPCCFSLFHRSSCPCICVPIFCPNMMAPCILNHNIYVRDAQKGKYSIDQARQAAHANSLYNDEAPSTSSPGEISMLPK